MTGPFTLWVIDRDGEQHEHGLRPTELWALLRALDPAQHRHVQLEAAALQVRVWPRGGEGPAGSRVCVRAQVEGRTAWLGQEREGPSFTLDGCVVPARLEVPITWASSALGIFVQGVRWPRQLPWYDDASWQPQGAWRGERFSFASTAGSMSDPALAAWVEGLHAELERLVIGSSEPRRAFAEAIAELRRVGHDLWSWDNDGDGESWGHDYMRATPGQGLALEARYEPVTTVGVRFGGVARGIAEDDDD